MDQTKCTVQDVMNSDKSNIKITIGQFYKLQCWKDVNNILSQEVSVNTNFFSSPFNVLYNLKPKEHMSVWYFCRIKCVCFNV